jgi:hypothetical protein
MNGGCTILTTVRYYDARLSSATMASKRQARCRQMKVTLKDNGDYLPWVGVLMAFVFSSTFIAVKAARNAGIHVPIDSSVIVSAFAPLLLTAAISTLTRDLERINFSAVAIFWTATLVVVLIGQIWVPTLEFQNEIFRMTDSTIAYRIIVALIYTMIGTLISLLIFRRSQIRHIGICVFSVFLTLIFLF